MRSMPVPALVVLFLIYALAGAAQVQPEPVRVAIAQELANLTPYTPDVPEPLLELVYDKLAAPSPYLADSVPWLAQSITPEGTDGRAWRIRLRDGIRWHDGKPFAADDVAFTLRYYRDGPANRWTHHVSDTPRLSAIEVLGRLDLRIACAAPCPDFDRVTAADLPILPAHLWLEVEAPHRYAGPIVGTGPYRLAKLVPGRYLRLEANPGYFAGTPRVPSLLVSFIRNPATAFAALRAGELDLVSMPGPPELAAALRRQWGLRLAQGEKPLNAVGLRINFERRPFSDPAFRTAFALALRPAEIVRRVALGQGRPGSLGFPAPDSPWTVSGLAQPGDDPAAAAKRLDSLGFLDRDHDGRRETATGMPLRFSLKVSSSEPLHLRAAQVVARQLEAVGIALRVETIDPGRHRALYANWHFDLLVGEIGAHGLADPDNLALSFRSGYLWRIPYPALDSLLTEWERAATSVQRRAAGFALQRFHQAAPTTLVLYYPQPYLAYRPRAFDGWRSMPGQGVFHKWSLVKFSLAVPGLPPP